MPNTKQFTIIRPILIAILVVLWSVTLSATFFNMGVEHQEEVQEEIERHIEDDDKPNAIKFIWNDDEESIPTDGSLVRIEFTDENNVYLEPIN